MDKPLLYAVATMTGMIIGAGTLGLPYVIAKAGFFIGLIHLLGIGLLMLLLNLYVGEIVLRTKEKHQLAGYAGKYLGAWGKKLMMIISVVGASGSLLAYIVGEGESFAALLGGSPFFYSIIFFLFVTTLVYAGVKAVSKTEFWFGIGKLFVILLLGAFLLPFLRIENMTVRESGAFFLPFGAVLFSYIGFYSIPEVGEILSREKKKVKKAIILGSIIPIIIYTLFSFFLVGALGEKTPQIATTGLASFGNMVFIFGNVFAILAMTTAFLAIALALVELYHFDYHIDKKIGVLFSCGIPFLLFLAGVTNFIQIISITGIVTGALGGFLVILIYLKAKKKGERIPEYYVKKNTFVTFLIILLLLLGSGYSLFTLF